MTKSLQNIAFDAGNEIYAKLAGEETKFENTDEFLKRLKNKSYCTKELLIFNTLVIDAFGLSPENERDRKLTMKDDLPAALELIAEQIALHTQEGALFCYKFGSGRYNREYRRGFAA